MGGPKFIYFSVAGTNIDEMPIKEELLRLGSEWAAAMVANDADRIGSFMADEWVIVSERGVSAKEHFLSFVRSGQLTHSMFEMTGDARIRVTLTRPCFRPALSTRLISASSSLMPTSGRPTCS